MSSKRRPATPASAGPGVGERILNTATELFYREGVRAVGIQRVIDEAGIAKASLYAHYKSKDDLVAAAIDKRVCTARTCIEARLDDPSLDARGKLLRLFDAQIEWIGSTEFRGCPLQNAVSEMADAAHPAKVVMATHRRWLYDLITRLTREAGIDPPETVAGALVVLYDGTSAAAQIDGNDAPARHARWAAEQIIDAHARPASKPRHRRSGRPRSEL